MGRAAIAIFRNSKSLRVLSTFASQKVLNTLKHSLRIFQLAFPNRQNGPAKFPQFLPVHSVAMLIACEFSLPKCAPRLRYRPTKLAVMAMPETSMNEDRLPHGRKNKVRAAGQGTNMQSTMVSECHHQSAYELLWLGMLPTDATCSAGVERASRHRSFLQGTTGLSGRKAQRSSSRWESFDPLRRQVSRPRRLKCKPVLQIHENGIPNPANRNGTYRWSPELYGERKAHRGR